MKWDPAQYARFGDERSRPFFELVRRIDADAPARVLDVGCGSGELTATLADRWPGAEVHGIDSSPEMIAEARPLARAAALTFAVGAAEDADPTGVDVLVCNAALQWVPTHRELLARWAAAISHGGRLAFQVPANFDAPSHVLMRELADSPAWRQRLDGVLRGTESVAPPEEYVHLLTHAGCTVDAWQTRYLHLLQGEDPVLEWVRGTGLRPVLQALAADRVARKRFTSEYARLLRDAYPPGPAGTIFPFLRTFVVATRSRAAA